MNFVKLYFFSGCEWNRFKCESVHFYYKMNNKILSQTYTNIIPNAFGEYASYAYCNTAHVSSVKISVRNGHCHRLRFIVRCVMVIHDMSINADSSHFHIDLPSFFFNRKIFRRSIFDSFKIWLQIVESTNINHFCFCF